MVKVALAQVEQLQFVALGGFVCNVEAAIYLHVSALSTPPIGSNIPARSPKNWLYALFSAASSKTTSNRLPDVLTADATAAKATATMLDNKRIVMDIFFFVNVEMESINQQVVSTDSLRKDKYTALTRYLSLD